MGFGGTGVPPVILRSDEITKNRRRDAGATKNPRLKIMKKLTHFRKRGEVAMVDVTAKAVTERTALARGFVRMSPAVLRALRAAEAAQGQSAGNRADCGDCGSQAHGGMDTSLSPAAADAH